MITKGKEIEQVIKDLLTTNTGKHLLDSGGAYGRNWERNQERDFEEEDPFKVDFTEYDDGSKELIVYVQLYTYLVNNLKLDTTANHMNDLLTEIIKDDENDSYHADLAELGNIMKYNIQSENTYNHDNILDQNFRCHFLYPMGEPREIYNVEYVAIQPHQGCDIRGGYSQPVIFKLKDIEYFIMGQRDISAVVNCGVGNIIWTSGNAGYNWRYCGRELPEEDTPNFMKGLHEEDGQIYWKDLGEVIFNSVATGF